MHGWWEFFMHVCMCNMRLSGSCGDQKRVFYILSHSYGSLWTIMWVSGTKPGLLQELMRLATALSYQPSNRLTDSICTFGFDIFYHTNNFSFYFHFLGFFLCFFFLFVFRGGNKENLKLGEWVGGKHLGRLGRAEKGNDYDQNILCEKFLIRREDQSITLLFGFQMKFTISFHWFCMIL